MKIVATVNKPEEAHLVRAHLEGSGIPAYVRDELTVSVDWAIANAIGGIKIEVADEDFAHARELLASPEVPTEVQTPSHSQGIARFLAIFLAATFLTFGAVAIRLDAASRLSVELALSGSAACGLMVALFCARVQRLSR